MISDRPMSIADWDLLPEDNSRQYELVRGVAVQRARPAAIHQRAARTLAATLDAQLPYEWEAALTSEIIVSERFPATIRVPDISVVPTALVDANPARLRARDVVLVIEFVSPESQPTDRLVTSAEYATVGIPRYWMLDTKPDVSLTTYELVGGTYESRTQLYGGMFVTDTPAPLHIDLDALTRRR